MVEAHRDGGPQMQTTATEQFSVTVGTILEDSHLPLRKWLMAFAPDLLSEEKAFRHSSLQRELDIGSYRTAWHLATPHPTTQ